MLERLRTERGFQIKYSGHASSILAGDFAGVSRELADILETALVPVEEIIAGGGGEAKGTQRLRRALSGAGWPKAIFKVQRTIAMGESESALEMVDLQEPQSHIVDHVKTVSVDGKDFRIALEIEWNTKDTFFDRDLENFKRLHADGAISLGIIVTRSEALHSSMKDIVQRFLAERQISSFEDLVKWNYEPTPKQRRAINAKIASRQRPMTFRDAFTSNFVSNKFGQATTHWSKLEERLRRGVGNPCPFVCIGLPPDIITFNEGEAALAELQMDEALAELEMNHKDDEGSEEVAS